MEDDWTQSGSLQSPGIALVLTSIPFSVPYHTTQYTNTPFLLITVHTTPSAAQTRENLYSLRKGLQYSDNGDYIHDTLLFYDKSKSDMNADLTQKVDNKYIYDESVDILEEEIQKLEKSFVKVAIGLQGRSLSKPDLQHLDSVAAPGAKMTNTEVKTVNAYISSTKDLLKGLKALMLAVQDLKSYRSVRSYKNSKKYR